MKIGALLKFYESGYNRYGDEKFNRINRKKHPYVNATLDASFCLF